MSQYPPPYSQPPYPQQPYPGQFDYYQPHGSDLLAPARRAAILMFVLGGLLAVLGACNSISALVINPTEAFEKQSQLLNDPQAFQMSPKTFRVMTVTFGIGMLVLGVLMIIFGAVVRRGSTGAIVASLIIVSLIVLGLLLLSLGSVVLAATGAMMGFITLCVFAIPLVLFVLLGVWLAQAAFAAPRVRALQQQYQTQMWQYQQQAAGGNWGYGAQAPPPIQAPPPTAPPPGDSQGPADSG